MAGNRYQALGLKDNPFPKIPQVDPHSPDPRMNGSIFNEEIVSDQLATLRRALERRENLIYAQNRSNFAVGAGKSALITHEWHRREQHAPETTAYVRVGANTSTLEDVCNAVVDVLTRKGALWKALLGTLHRYAREAPNPVLDRGVVDALIATNPRQPRTVPVHALMLWDIKGKVEAVATWLEELSPRVNRDVASLFLTSMLTEPPKFIAGYPKAAKKREISAFITVMEIMKVGGINYLFIFIDQFEDLLQDKTPREILKITSGMRELLLAATDYATFVVTLHPNAHMTLTSIDHQGLTTIAPLDTRRVVDLTGVTPTQAVRLAETYVHEYRLAESNGIGTVAPFEESFVESITLNPASGNIRKVLETLRRAVDIAADEGRSIIDTDFLREHYQDITGQVSEEDMKLT